MSLVASLRLAQAQPAELAGLWGLERNFGPEVHGELTIIRDGEGWTARIGPYQLRARPGSSVRFSLPAAKGDFRGTLTSDGDRILGHWIQPWSRFHWNQFASPVTLRSIANGVFRGTVTPLDEELSLYLLITQNDEGREEAIFRNPDRNFRAGARSFRIEREANDVFLHNPAREDHSIAGAYLPATDTLTFRISSFDTTLEFTRRNRSNAPGFYPTPTTAPYAYSPPIREDDGWATADLKEVGLDRALLSKLIEPIVNADTSDPDVPLVQGLLISRHGRLVLEEYFYGFYKERVHDLRSASKSFTSLMIGIALDRGASFRPSTSVVSLFPEYEALANPDPRKDSITVEHLLTMSSGLACDDNDSDSPGQEGRMSEQKAQADWYKYALDLPTQYNPGEQALYCSAGVNLLGGVLRNTTGEWIPDFFRRRLAEPLQIGEYYINLMPTGEAYMGGGLRLRPRDALKIGQVVLDRGTWNGARIVSEAWIERSTKPRTQLNPDSRYGYNWWLHELHSGDRSYDAVVASGNGGQLLIVVRELDLVVLFTGGNYNRYPIWRRFLDEMVPEFVIPAVLDR